jgi:hypothetical protein
MAVAAGADIGDAVRIDGAVLSRRDLVGAATSVAERVGGARCVAVLARLTATTMVTGCPCPSSRCTPTSASPNACTSSPTLARRPGRGAARRSGRAAAYPGAAECSVLASLCRAAAGGDRAGDVHVGHHGSAQGWKLSRRAIAAHLDALAQEDVPCFMELRWRSGEYRAALRSSLCRSGRTGSAISRSSAARSVGRCRWPDAAKLLAGHGVSYSSVIAIANRSLPTSIGRVWGTCRASRLSQKSQRRSIEAIGGVQTIVPVDTCHDPMVSEPERLAEILVERCRLYAS